MGGGWPEAQVSCCVTVSEADSGNLQGFSAIPLPRLNLWKPSASAGSGWSLRFGSFRRTFTPVAMEIKTDEEEI